MDPKKTGMIILQARKRLQMTQKDLADKLYVSDKAVSKWERGLCFPDISVLIPLTEILNISLYDLLRGEKVNKKEVEETLKNTINYSNSEIDRIIFPLDKFISTGENFSSGNVDITVFNLLNGKTN